MTLDMENWDLIIPERPFSPMDVFIVDLTSFSPKETGLTIEGDEADILNTITALQGLGIAFTDNPEFEKKNIRNRKDDITIMIFLVTGKKMNLGDWLDKWFKGKGN